MINKEEAFLPNRWQVYIGIMVESTAKKNQRWFHVYVPEFQPEVTGDVQPDFEKKDAKIGNVWLGKPTTEEGKLRNILNPVTDGKEVNVIKTIYADYFNFNTSEDVPTMYRDMQVLVLNYANTDKWYWLPLECDRSYKTFEHIRISANNIAKTNKTPGVEKDKVDERNKGVNDEDTYFLEIDTKYHKRVIIHTGHSDGEKWDYTFEINAVKNSIEIHDKCVDGSQPNNTIKIESKPDAETKGRIIVQNASGTSVVLTGEDAIVNVPRNLQFFVGGDYQLEVAGNYSERIMGDRTRIVDGQESTEVFGDTNHKYNSNLEEAVVKNKRTSVQGQNEEIQGARKTVSGTASWESTTSFTLSTNMFMAKIQTMQLETLIANIKSNVMSMEVKYMAMMFMTNVFKIGASMLWWLPINAVIPKIPIPTHTTIK